MSGVMTKVAVYGFVRIAFDLLGPPAWWWSMLVLAVGGITAVMGVLYALMQHDLKRLLAYHTVENIGIIYIGLGLALAFKAHDMDVAAALALTAGLLHVFNHSIFKSLLFFGAGAVLNATGERDMEHLGGLIHRMPQTAFVFLVGCVAISALPPLNGFVSEWLTFQAILLSPQLPVLGTEIPGPGGRRAAGAVGGAGGRMLRQGVRRDLPRPASHARRGKCAAKPTAISLAAMFFLAALCLLAGILPGLFIDALAPVSNALVGASMPHQAGVEWLTIVPIAESRSSYNGLLVFIFVACLRLDRRIRHSSPGVRQIATRTGLGLRLSGPEARQRNTLPRASRSRSAAFMARALFRAREIGDMPPPGINAPGAADCRTARSDLGHGLCAGRSLCRLRLRSGSMSCNS